MGHFGYRFWDLICMLFQDRLKSGQERPKSGQERPKSVPRAAKSGPRAAKSGPREAKRGKIVWFSDVCSGFCEQCMF